MLTTVQDLGRWGFQSRGVSVSGPMDLYSHRLANALVGNPADLATLEVTLVGPELEFGDSRIVAVAGASFDLTIEGAEVAMHTPWAVAGGARLKFGRRKSGARAYIGVASGIAVPPVLGSRATHVTSAMGGVDGRALRAGDRLPLGPTADVAGSARRVDDGSIGRGLVRGSEARRFDDEAGGTPSPTRIRVMPGPQLEFFASDALSVLQAAPYRVEPQSNRMAFRLSGQQVTRARDTEMISDATPMGTLQVLPTGLPLLLMADRQTTGGYPQLATVITADLPIAGQLAPGESFTFRACTAAEAAAALIAQERVLLTAESRWRS